MFNEEDVREPGLEPQYTFYDGRSVEAWLHTSPEGRKVLERAVDEACKMPVLVVLGSDGRVDVHARKGLRVKIVQKLYAETPKGEVLVEKLLRLRLPYNHKPLFWPGLIREWAYVRKVTPQQESDRLAMMDLFKDLDDWGKRWEPQATLEQKSLF